MLILRARSFAALATATALTLAVAGCGSDDNGGDGSNDSKEDVAPVAAEFADMRNEFKLDKPFDFKQGAGTDLLPEYIAKAKGFFKAYNLDVEVIPAKVGGVAWIPLLASGELDVTAGAGVSAPIVSLANGADVTAVAAGFVTSETYHNFGVWAKKDSGITSAIDLEGKRIAIANVGSTIDIGLDAWVKAAGGDPSKVKKVVVPYANMPQALDSDQVDAIGEVIPIMDPWIADNASAAENMERIAWESDLLPSDKLYTAYTMRTDFVDDNPDVVQAWIAAMTEATQWITENPEEAAQIAVEADAIPSVDVPTPSWPTGLCIDTAESASWIELLEGAKQIETGQVGVDSWYTNELNPTGCE